MDENKIEGIRFQADGKKLRSQVDREEKHTSPRQANWLIGCSRMDTLGQLHMLSMDQNSVPYRSQEEYRVFIGEQRAVLYKTEPRKSYEKDPVSYKKCSYLVREGISRPLRNPHIFLNLTYLLLDYSLLSFLCLSLSCHLSKE